VAAMFFKNHKCISPPTDAGLGGVHAEISGITLVGSLLEFENLDSSGHY